MTDLQAFRGKLAIVTGAGDGIGRMLALKFASLGMKVCVQDIRGEAAQGVAEEIGDAAFPLVFDVSDRAAAMEAANQLAARNEPVSILWINAGVGVGSPVLAGNPRNIEWAFGVNVLGVIWTAQAFYPLMKDAEGPRHVGITASSAALREPSGDFPLYATTKHGTFAVAEALKGELEEDGVGVTVLCPGLLNTKIWDGAKARPERFGGERRMDPSIATAWNEAKLPDVMWPHIASSLESGGGYLTCDTDGNLADFYSQRTAMIGASIIKV